VKEIAARGGQAVKEGQLLLRGDDAEDKALLAIQKLRAQTPLNVDAAKARLDLAKVEHERIKTAQSQGAASQPEVERARLQAEISRLDWELAKDAQQQEVLQLERMQARADRYSLKAPFDGTVDLVNADLGQVVSENEKIVRVVDTDPLWIDVPAETGRSETLLLKVGAPAWVMSDSGGLVAVREGKVIEVAPTVDPASRTRRIRVELPNPSGSSALLAGEPVTVRFTPPEGTHGRPQETESK
jgi:RND family efflux transporter MFP subunit